MWKNVPAPATVTPCSLRNRGVVWGSKASANSSRQPVSRLENNQSWPPMWVNGNTIALRSSPVIASRSHMPMADAMIVASVCLAPFGSAVVPDV